ncbi:hypothetical protein [Derxia lacustris]|uniref:hypothetical protein n=1 Tax=Derxia lacustris TaxID=764842 RepID=UPI000A16D2C5|nr:hypothetical protein [Derxia lacustris]
MPDPALRLAPRRPRWALIFGALAATLAAVFALRGCLLDADSGPASLADQLARRMPEARVLIGTDGVLRAIHPDGLVQTLDLEPLRRLCASQPGSCEVDIRRLLGLFAASRAAGFARDSADGARLRPFVLGAGDDEALAATRPLAAALAPAALPPGAAAADANAAAADLRVGLGLRTGEVVSLVTPAALDRYGLGFAPLLAEAVANLDADAAPVRLDPLLLNKGVSQLAAPGDPAAQLLSPARMRVLLGAIHDRAVAFAVPRRGRLLLARDREPDLAALAAAAAAVAPPAASTEAPTAGPTAGGNSPAGARSVHRYALDANDRPVISTR